MGAHRDASRRFNRTQRVALFLAAGGRCQQCGRLLRRGWHADHIVPVSRGGETEIENGRATCGKCNRRKGSTMPIPLRRWQERAIAAYFTAGKRDFLIVATPGSGKTRVAAEIARQSFVGARVDRLIVVVPTVPLRAQWADALADHGRHVDPTWKVGDLVPPDVDAIVITFAAVASNPMVLRRLATEKRTLVVFDEIHHCGDDEHLSWGPAILDAFSDAAWRLSLSGTPFRSDSARIPFVTYLDGVARMDEGYGIGYGYQDSVAENVCRLVFFPSIGGQMEWQFGEAIQRARIEEAEGDRHALRTAIMADGGWIAQTFDDAHRKLVEVRLTDPDAAGLIVCDGIGHAYALARVLRRRTGLSESDVVVVASRNEGDEADRDAPQRIRAFRDARAPWIVAVRMISEGIDIPRIRVVVWATADKTELLFRQVKGRETRCEPDHDDHTAWMFVPADADLLEWAAAIAQERTHAIAEDEDKIDRTQEGNGQARAFLPISSEGARGDTITIDGRLTEAEISQADTAKQMDPATATLPSESLALFLRNVTRVDRPPSRTESGGTPDHERRKALRTANQRAAQAVSMRRGVPFAEVGGRLNRSVGIRGITEATIPQLEQRLKVAAHWRDTGDDSHVAG